MDGVAAFAFVPSQPDILSAERCFFLYEVEAAVGEGAGRAVEDLRVAGFEQRDLDREFSHGPMRSAIPQCPHVAAADGSVTPRRRARIIFVTAVETARVLAPVGVESGAVTRACRDHLVTRSFPAR